MTSSHGRPSSGGAELDAVSREVYFSGRVQGVGFRQTTWTIAQHYVITGYVENLPDGRVHLEVEGPRGEIDQFLAELQRKMGHFIQSTEMDDRAVRGHWEEFTIEH